MAARPRAFDTPPPPPDTDGDGVADPHDRCPNPPPGRIAERLGITDAEESKKLDAAAQAQYDDYNEKMRAM